MDKKIIRPTDAYELLLQNVSSVLDCRDQGISSGILASDMDDIEAINWLNSLTLWNFGYDHKFSPSIFYSFLHEYCSAEYAEGLAFFYPQLAARDGVILDDDIWNLNTGILIDVYAYAQKTKECGGKKHWGVTFKYPYIQQWIDAFEGERPVRTIPSFISRLLGKATDH